MKIPLSAWVVVFTVLICNNFALSKRCKFYDLSEAVASVLCNVQEGFWTAQNSSSLKSAGCLLGGNRCKNVLHVPTSDQVSQSIPPPNAKNKQYQMLATTAESVVPKTWWRAAFANDVFLLTHNDSDLPRKLFDSSKTRNKKLKNMVQCVTRQQFIRKSLALDFVGETENAPSKCGAVAMKDPAIKLFFQAWQVEGTRQKLGGSSVEFGTKDWKPDAPLASLASDVLDFFYSNHGGIWTGCFKLEKDSDCRGALSGIVECSVYG